jgi:hypothetical protein
LNSYCEGGGEGETVHQHIVDASLTNVLKVFVGLENVQFFEEHTRGAEDENEERLPNIFVFLRSAKLGR